MQVRKVIGEMTDDHGEMKQYYEEWWENPKDPRDFIFKQLNDLVMQRLPEGAGKTALDIGSGKGAIVSMLRRKDYRVTALELNDTFARDLRTRFPEVSVMEGDIRAIELRTPVDTVTAMEFLQNLDEASVRDFLRKVAGVTPRIVLSISTKYSIHGVWTAYRRFQKSFVYTYTPRQIESMLADVGFEVTYGRGIGLLTPITLLSEFRLRIIPAWLAKFVNLVGDTILPRMCHLYYLEASKRRDI